VVKIATFAKPETVSGQALKQRKINMKHLFIFLFLTFNASAQEICTNGLDDDNDGLIDLNDNFDCECISITSVPSGNNFLPNPSFEDYNCLPSQFSQIIDTSVNWQDGIYCVDNWQPGTWGSSDYFVNTPAGFWPNIPTPLPNGQAAAGFFIINLPDIIGFDGNIDDGIYLEYLKTCLTQPIQAGSSYNLQLNLAGIGMSSFGNALTNIWFGPVDITLFGSSICTQSAIQTVSCPPVSTDWVELGHASYQADGTWQILNIPFTALNSIQSIMIGGPCSPPNDFIFSEANGETFDPYFVLDNAALYEINLEDCNFDLIIPNVITPNSDGVNEFFVIQNLPENTEVIIYNRWGNLVFSSTNYQNNWNGKNTTGKDLVDGVYFYKIKTTAGKIGHGFIHLLR
jgi:gliding motility-associated-like protein